MIFVPNNNENDKNQVAQKKTKKIPDVNMLLEIKKHGMENAVNDKKY